MPGALMTSDEYYAGASITSRDRTAIQAAGPAPENVVNGRNWGDEFWSAIRSGGAATAESAAKVSAVYFCTSIIAVTLGSLPREITDPDGKTVEGSDLGELLDEEPNLLQTGDDFWSSMAFRAALAGRSFAEPVDSGFGLSLWPLDPRRYTVDDRERGFTVHYSPEHGPTRYLSPLDVFWINGLADAQHKPLTPWKMARGSIDFALAMEQQGREFFQNGSRLAGFLSTDRKLTDPAIAHLKEGISRWRSGKIPVLEDGLNFKEAMMTNTDAELRELIKQRTIELARYWHIPRSMVSEEGSSKSNQEQEDRQFGKYVIQPWGSRIEKAVRARLMTPTQRKNFRFKFNLEGLYSGDSSTQWRNAVLARTAGALSINELRVRWFGMPKIDEDWADDPNQPLNSNRAADQVSGGMTAPQDGNNQNRVQMTLGDLGIEL